MARNVAANVENNFINGFVTEATALNFPEAAATESFNCTYTLKGNVIRRLGIDYETGFTTDTVDRSNVAVCTFYWRSAAGTGSFNFVVRQIGLVLYFFRVQGSALSAGRVSATIDLSGHLVSGAPSDAAQKECQFASGRGYLFVCHPYVDPVYVSYDPNTDSFTSNSITIQIRDFDGVIDDQGFDIGFRPPHSGNTPKYSYNVYNQGWAPFGNGGVGALAGSGGLSGSNSQFPPPSPNYIGDPWSTWFYNRNDLPSYADVWWLYKDALEQFQPSLADAYAVGNSPAPKGHYLLNAFYQDRSAASGIPGLPVVSSSYLRPQAVAFFAGRVFYAGVDTGVYGNKVYFSQIVQNEQQFGRCYQTNDPTSEHLFDLLATDGGEVNVLDCGTIIKLVSIQTSLLIFATNGVWAINGSSGIGFSANDFTVRKLSSIPTISNTSFVDVAGAPAWWNTDGIYIVSGADALGTIQISSLTERKIKTYYTTEIPANNKNYVRGDFNNLTKVIQWAFRSRPIESKTQNYEFDSILCFNTITQAFYLHNFPVSDVTLNDIVAIQGLASGVVATDVTDGAGAVVTLSGGTHVQTMTHSTIQTAATFKYMISKVSGGSYELSFAEEYDTSYLDFKSIDDVGQDYVSYFVSGFKVHGEGQRKFQSNYLFLYLQNDTPGGECQFQSIWDYANDPQTGDYGTKQYVTWPPWLQRDYVFKRLKLRGSGMTLQFKVTSITGQPFNIAGWSGFETANGSV